MAVQSTFSAELEDDMGRDETESVEVGRSWPERGGIDGFLHEYRCVDLCRYEHVVFDCRCAESLGCEDCSRAFDVEPEIPTTAVIADGANELHDRVSRSAAEKVAIVPGSFILRPKFCKNVVCFRFCRIVSSRPRIGLCDVLKKIYGFSSRETLMCTTIWQQPKLPTKKPTRHIPFPAIPVACYFTMR